ncbi:hypothetical protein QE418_001440 [Microbacterium testaceum]|nr:hypothetical protein [Microbacterium testaceum]
MYSKVWSRLAGFSIRCPSTYTALSMMGMVPLYPAWL